MMTASDLELAAVARPRSAAWYAWNFGSERAARIWQLYYHRRGIRLCLAEATDRILPGAFPADAAEARCGIVVSTALRTGNGFTGHPPVTPAVRLDAQKAAGQVPESFLFMNRYRVGPAYMACLDRMLVRAARQNVPVLIVDMPVPADLTSACIRPNTQPTEAPCLRRPRPTASRCSMPTRSAVGLTDADFSDLIHLNGNGAAKLSAWLRTVVTAAGEATP